MNLTEALRTNNATKTLPEALTVSLATGFTPLSLSPFLSAHLAMRIPGHRIVVKTGSYGDLRGNLERTNQAPTDMAAVCIEWDDLDPRLGMRRLSRITWKDFADILNTARNEKDLLISLVHKVADRCLTAVSLPQLTLPSIFYTPLQIVGEFEAELRLLIAEMQVQLASKKGVRVVRTDTRNCLDLSSLLRSGFPYSIECADRLGESLASSLVTASPKKGIIVDLDDTMWKGILGDDGIQGVQWSLDHHAQHHGLFQQFLHALAAEGTLIAITSKNALNLVQEMFAQRHDLILQSEDVFPMEVHWGPKSESIARILQVWNIAADAVVFVDDSELELADVTLHHPGMLCRSFPTRDIPAFEHLLRELRTLFAKDRVGDEDGLRMQSLRARAGSSKTIAKSNPETLLKELQSELVFDFTVDASDERSLELINKTNQFNLNGIRITEPAWRRSLSATSAFLMTCSYKDRFGELGKIAVVSGTLIDKQVSISSWVMSCRAFARRIEFSCLHQVFERYPVSDIVLRYQQTERNAPMRTFLEQLGMQNPATGELVLTRTQFEAVAPAVHHTTITRSNELKEKSYV